MLVLVCGLVACGPNAVNRDRAFEKVKEFLTEEYAISESNVPTYKNVYYAGITGNGEVTRDDLISDVYFVIRISFCGFSGNQYLYYDVKEDKVGWRSNDASYDFCVDSIENGDLKGAWGK